MPWPRRFFTHTRTYPHKSHTNPQYCDRGSLRDAVKGFLFHQQLPGGAVGVDIASVVDVLQDVAYAVQYLHNVHLLHGDIKVGSVGSHFQASASEGGRHARMFVVCACSPADFRAHGRLVAASVTPKPQSPNPRSWRASSSKPTAPCVLHMLLCPARPPNRRPSPPNLQTSRTLRKPPSHVGRCCVPCNPKTCDRPCPQTPENDVSP